MQQSSRSTHVVVKCKVCQAEFEISRKDLSRTADKNKGYVPCYYCHSLATVWDISGKGTDGELRK